MVVWCKKNKLEPDSSIIFFEPENDGGKQLSHKGRAYICLMEVGMRLAASARRR
jgi:hypothetical protein